MGKGTLQMDGSNQLNGKGARFFGAPFVQALVGRIIDSDKLIRIFGSFWNF
jgi:hypothetical protein